MAHISFRFLEDKRERERENYKQQIMDAVARVLLILNCERQIIEFNHFSFFGVNIQIKMNF